MMDERRIARDVIDLEVTGTVDGQSAPLVVYDISVAGCMIALRGEIHSVAGSKVTLDLPAIGLVEGNLAWVKGHAGGVQFSHPLPESVVELLQPAPRTDRFDGTFRDRFGRPLASLQRRFAGRADPRAGNASG